MDSHVGLEHWIEMVFVALREDRMEVEFVALWVDRMGKGFVELYEGL